MVSFDDSSLLEDSGIRILSVIHPKYELGRLAARNLLRMMEDPDWQNKNYSHQFPVSINHGNSVKNLNHPIF